MTEAEWLTCDDRIDLYEFIKSVITERKVRLYVTACTRLTPREPTPILDAATDVVERAAEGQLGREDVEAIHRQAASLSREIAATDMHSPAHFLALAAERLTHWPVPYYPPHVPGFLSEALGDKPYETYAINDQRGQVRHLHSALMREIVPNPFRPVAFDLSWRSSAVVALAEAIYAERAFDRMPILADALEEAGCDDADILTHCRGGGPHVRGCWVVDLVLGKS